MDRLVVGGPTYTDAVGLLAALDALVITATRTHAAEPASWAYPGDREACELC